MKLIEKLLTYVKNCLLVDMLGEFFSKIWIRTNIVLV